MTGAHIAVTVLAWLMALATVALYLEEIAFIIRTFRFQGRKEKTVYFLGMFPVSLCLTVNITGIWYTMTSLLKKMTKIPPTPPKN